MNDDLDTELEFHFTETIEALKAKGLTTSEARAEAERRFGDRRRYRQSLARLQHTISRRQTMRAFFHCDLRAALRSLRATPVLTAIAVLSLALGVGANTALFSIVNGLMMKPLPVSHPEALVLVDGGSWTNPIWEAIRERRTTLFADALAWSEERFDLSDAGERDLVNGSFVSGSFFEALGVGTSIGRPLTRQDDQRGGGDAGPLAVISHALWQGRFGGVDDVVGRQLHIDHATVTIVGVAPPHFQGPVVGRATHIYLPLASEAALRPGRSSLDQRSSWWLEIMARLKPGQTVEAAALALNQSRLAIREETLPQDWDAEMRDRFLSTDFTLSSAKTGPSSTRTRYAEPLTIIMVVVLGVLLIACANIANLMLARATARRADMSLRMALGASRSRLTRQLLAEGLILALTGCLAGLAFAQWGGTVLVRQLGSAVTTITIDLSLDWRVMAFTATLAVATTLFFGLVPAAGLSQVSPIDALNSAGRRTHGDRRGVLRHGLVILQLAVSVVLVVGAVLFGRTFLSLMTTPLGFTPDNRVIVTVDTSNIDGPQSDIPAIAERVTQAARNTAGITMAATSVLTPLSNHGWNDKVISPAVAGLTPQQQLAFQNAITPGWFETYGMRVLAGRDVSSEDRVGSPPVALVNEAFVRQFFGGAPPVGQDIAVGRPATPDRYTVVGVVNDAAYRSVRDEVPPTIYAPLAQAGTLGQSFALTVVVDGPQQATLSHLTDALTQTDARLAFSFRDYADQFGAAVARERLVAMLSSFFGALALLLAGLGLYGVTSYSVSVRRPEMAVRMALGGTTLDIQRLILHQVGWLVGVGLAFGVGASLWLSQLVSTLLFNVAPRDPATLVVTIVTLGLVGLLAGWLPARRAARIDPNVVLRQ